MITLTSQRPATIVASLLLSVLTTSSLVSQGSRDLRAERLVLDDNNSHTVTIQTPHLPAGTLTGNYVLTIPEPSASAATFLLSHPAPGSSGQTINGSMTVADTLRADDVQTEFLSAPASGSLRIRSSGSVTIGIDEDNNGTGSTFVVESNGAATPDLFRVTETGLTDVTSSSSTGAFRITNTNSGGTAKILELLDGTNAQFTVRRNGTATLAGDLTVDGTGTSAFAGSVNVGDFLRLVQESQTALAANATLTATASHLVVAGGTAAVTLSGTNAVANGSTVGQLLLLVGNSSTNTVSLSDGANVQLGAVSRTLAQNDILTLLWNGADWIEISFADN